MKKCKCCKQLLNENNAYRAGFRKNVQVYRNTCKKCYLKEIENKRQRIIDIAKSYFGSFECSKCGYNKCSRALHFHHLEPKEKDYQISNMHSFSEKKVLTEIKKCIILCANCHAEEHQYE